MNENNNPTPYDESLSVPLNKLKNNGMYFVVVHEGTILNHKCKSKYMHDSCG